MHEIETENIYEGFRKDKQIFNFSNYLAKLKYNDDSNKFVVGKMKDETGDVTVEEFVGW